jgi:hypothetical protein
MNTRIYPINAFTPERGSVAFDYNGWIISVSTVGGVYAEVLAWKVTDDGKKVGSDFQMHRAGAYGVLDAVTLIDQGGEVSYTEMKRG